MPVPKEAVRRPSIAVLLAIVLSAASLLSVAPSAAGATFQPTIYTATLANQIGIELGTVVLASLEEDDAVIVDVTLTGLPAGGFHALHLHPEGSCMPHGGPLHEHVTLPVVLADAAGNARQQFITDQIGIDDFAEGTVAVHERPDNYGNVPDRYVSDDGPASGGPDETTLATGDAGARLACGVFAEATDFEPDMPVGGEAHATVLVDTDGAPTGFVGFTAVEGGVLVEAEVFGLDPGAFHGFHVHEGPTCTDDAGRIGFDAAQGHYNPGDGPHGAHAGDMPVLWTDSEGEASLAFVTDRLSPETLAGRAVIVHSDPDNYANIPNRYRSTADGAPARGPDEETLDAGDAGDRLRCGLVDGTALRLSGPNRFETAIAISRASFADGEAEAAVIARADRFADGLAGTPLAVERRGPLLLSTTESLSPETTAELGRVLDEDATVYLLGGVEALSPDVEATVRDLGYTVERLAGSTRIETAIAIARELDDPGEILITTGYRFPDALAAGAAAGSRGGAVLLTVGEQRHAAVDAYLAERAGVDVYAVGGPAARPYPEAEPVFGGDRIATAVAVAETFFPDGALAVGVARQGGIGDDSDTAFADALTGGAHAAMLGAPVLLTPTGGLAGRPAAYVAENAELLLLGYLYGGTAALAPQVHAELQAALRP